MGRYKVFGVRKVTPRSMHYHYRHNLRIHRIAAFDVEADGTIHCTGTAVTKLKDRQRLFATEYCVDRNASQAAFRAGHSPRTARQQVQRLLTNVDVQELS